MKYFDDRVKISPDFICTEDADFELARQLQLQEVEEQKRKLQRSMEFERRFSEMQQLSFDPSNPYRVYERRLDRKQ